MKAYFRTGLIVFGILGLLAGLVLMILGKMIALLLFLTGFAALAAYVALMMRTGEYRAEGTFFNGLMGQGRQQSEVSKDPDAWKGTQNGSIWDRMNGNQE